MNSKDETKAEATTGGVSVEREVRALLICPGCGTKNPKSRDKRYFSCAVCEWELDAKRLPTVGEILDAGRDLEYNSVQLGMFLRTLLREP